MKHSVQSTGVMLFFTDMWGKGHITCMWPDNYELSFCFRSEAPNTQSRGLGSFTQGKKGVKTHKILYTINLIQIPCTVCCSMRSKEGKVWGSVKVLSISAHWLPWICILTRKHNSKINSCILKFCIQSFASYAVHLILCNIIIKQEDIWKQMSFQLKKIWFNQYSKKK